MTCPHLGGTACAPERLQLGELRLTEVPPCPSRNRFRDSVDLAERERLRELHVHTQRRPFELRPERVEVATTFEIPDLAIGDTTQVIEHRAVAADAECCLDPGVG